jgi:hypothetical protein
MFYLLTIDIKNNKKLKTKTKMKTKLYSIGSLCLSLLITASIVMVSCSKDLTPSDPVNIPPDLVVSPQFKAGKITYTLIKVANPTADQADAYAKIKAAMDAAVAMYNNQANLTKTLTVQYVPSVATADGNINGNIRFGSNRSYMTQCTAMHEIAHTLGVGTSSKWSSLMVNGVWQGAKATAMIRSMVGETSTSVIHGDAMHFWPYGLNYNSEWSTVNGQRNARIVGAMKADGL